MQECVDLGQISSAQLETIIYANDRFNQRLDNGSGVLLTMLTAQKIP